MVKETFAQGNLHNPQFPALLMRAKLGDFVFLHLRNFDTWGRISKVPNLANDPLADIYEIIDHRGRITWTRSSAIKFLHPSREEPLSGVGKSLELPASVKEQIKNWAFSLKEEQTFHLSNVVEALGKERWEMLGNYFAIFRFLYIFSTDWLQKDATFRVNGPFTLRTAAERQLIEGGDKGIYDQSICQSIHQDSKQSTFNTSSKDKCSIGQSPTHSPLWTNASESSPISLLKTQSTLLTPLASNN